MNAETRVWIVGAAVMVAGIALIVVGAVASVPELVVALPATGAGLLGAGLVAVLVKQPWESRVRRSDS